jgi:hypothetical protein
MAGLSRGGYMATTTPWLAPTTDVQLGGIAERLTHGALRSWALPSGETAIVRHDSVPIPQNLLEEYERVRSLAGQTRGAIVGNASAFHDGDKRAVVFVTADGHKFALDVPVTSARSH